MHSTLKGCSTELQAQDEWLSQFLQSKPKIGLDGNTLTLTGADAAITLSDE
jgi:heat shock protein HslJ